MLNLGPINILSYSTFVAVILVGLIFAQYCSPSGVMTPQKKEQLMDASYSALKGLQGMASSAFKKIDSTIKDTISTGTTPMKALTRYVPHICEGWRKIFEGAVRKCFKINRFHKRMYIL